VSPKPPGRDAPHPFRPAWWLPGRHLRTLWGRLGRRIPVVASRRDRLRTPDDDILELDRFDGVAPDAPRLVVLHGLEGTPESRYARGMLAEAQRRGWGADLLYFRSCAGTLNRARRLYHSGETSDLAFVVDHLAREYPRSPLVFAGFSLGGNVLLKWLGECGTDLPVQVRGAAAVSVPFDLARGARHIGKGFARIYEASFLRSLKRKTLAKLEHYPDLTDPVRLARSRSIYQFDDAVTAPVHGFQSADDYYARSSSLGYLPSVRVPTLLLSAADDPFLPPAVLGEVRAVAARTPALTLEFVARGGHVGFVMGPPWRPFYYAEWRVADFLARVLDTASHDRHPPASAHV
jgi:predicted alpha/beta-fold hydrolase